MAHNKFADLLKRGGFQGFLWTQFLGAFNDSVYQTIVALHLGNVHPAYVPLVIGTFTLPSLLFSGYSGHLADVVSKRSVMISIKFFEVAIMLFGLWTLWTGWAEGMLGVVFLMGLHAAIFSPAKYGIVPEILGDRDLSRGNALLEMSTFVSIVLGIAAGGKLFSLWHAAQWRIGLVTLAVSLTGVATSFGITRVPASGAKQQFRWNPFAEIGASTRTLLKDRPLWLAVLGVSYFWFAGALLKTNLQFFGLQVLKIDDNGVSILWAFLAIGIGAGNILAGRLSGDKVELGLVPLGALLMSFFTLLTFLARHSLLLSTICVVGIAVSSGLFVVPLYAYIQQRSDKKQKGRVVATNNFYQTIGMLIATGIMLLYTPLHWRADWVLFGFGISLALAAGYILTVVPDYFVRFVLWLLTHSVFKIKIKGAGNVPFRGPALLVANHMSHVDGMLIGACVQRFIRFMVWKPYYEMKSLNWFLRHAKAIPVGGGGPRDVVESIRAARRELEAGHMVCIFAEGAISRTGNMLPFKRGMEKIVDGLEVPIIPVHLDRLWGSIFSFEGGKFFWKWPKRIPYPVTVSFGAPLPPSSSAHEVRQAIQELGSDAAASRPFGRLDLRVVHVARSNWRSFAMADSTGRELTYGRLLAGAVMARNWMRGHVRGEERIGVILPATAAGALVNIGATLAGKVPVNLNFTAGAEAITSAIEQCGIRTVITSRAFLGKIKGQLPEFDQSIRLIYVEDLFRASKAAQLWALVMARLMPAGLLSAGADDSLATIVFSSGSTGVPKGVMLTHRNILANIEAIAQVFWIGPSDRIIGGLPFFHSFGYTVGICFPLVCGCGVVYHPNPTDSRIIGELTAKYHATFLLATPTICSGYTRKCTREEFASLRFVLVGAEKLRPAVAEAFHEKFGIDLLEGYGCTEMSPVVAVNVPNFEAAHNKQTGTKPGTVGHPLPGVAVRIVDPVTFEPLPPNNEGLLLVKGPNRMEGYLNQAQKTAEVLRDGWYITGDIALVDDEGFLKITDRLSRFSKVGGEMVPHVRIEEAIGTVIGDSPCAVTAVEDDQRGERLVALYARPDITPETLWQQLAQTGLPRLWIPKRENLYLVDQLPVLGTGKLDLRAVKARAQQLAAVTA